MRNSGYLVTTKTGLKGRTYHNKGLINGKVPVYLETGKHQYDDNAILCVPDTLKMNGFID